MNKLNKKSLRTPLTKLIALLLITTLVVSTTSHAKIAAAKEPVSLAMYEDKYFTTISEAEPLNLFSNADSVSLYGICRDTNKTENLTCYIMDLKGDLCYNALDFVADGSVWTYSRSIPEGVYRVFFVGNGEFIQHATAVFSTSNY